MEERELDTRGLNCPLPVLKARKTLQGMAKDERLRVLATDPKAPGDLAELCAAAGHRLISSSEEAGVFVVVVARA